MSTPLRVLILEDRPDDARLMLHELRQAGFAPAWVRVEDEAGFLARLDPPPDLICADYCLPQFDALRALRRVQERGVDVPFIIVSGSIGEDQAVAAMRQGAADYLLKDRLARLGPAAQHALEQKRLRDEKRRVEQALRASEQSLREANRRKDEFLGMLAHELRNPLGPILNGLHIFHLACLDRPDLEQARAMMERQVHHMARLVDQLLDVSRIAHGKIRLAQSRLDLARLVRTTAEDRRGQLAQAGQTLTLEVPETPLWVQGDATRLAQVLYNLLDNAVKFAGGGDRVTVALAAGADGQAVLCVRDGGTGIDPELLPHLFEPFTQADRSLDRARGGLGLGLALVKGLVELHGGKVEAASAGPGCGAEFTVRLPREGEPAALSGQPSAAQPDAVRQRILIVEDNRDAADSLRLLLELLGHEVAVAYSGPDGVARATAWRPDLVLCDLGLPGLDGYGVAAALRQHAATAQARLIAVTGYGQDEDRRRSREAGFDHHLVKPADPHALQALLQAPQAGEPGHGQAQV